MTKRQSATTAAALLGVVAGWTALRGFQTGASAALPAPGPNTATVLLWMGVNATAEQRWDGEASVTGGRLVAVRGRHFSAGDSVGPDMKWKAVTRLDRVAPYADLHYTEMRPGSVPEVRHQPMGVYLHLDAPPAARVQVTTQQGNFSFAVADLKTEPVAVLGGKALVMRVAEGEKLTGDAEEDDEPSIAALPGGGVAVAWVAYRNRADRVLLRTRNSSGWSAAEEVSAQPGDIFKTSLAALADGTLWVFWSQRDNQTWTLWGRSRKGSTWSQPERISQSGSASFHRAAAGGGAVFAVWQGFNGSQSDIYLRAWSNGSWQPQVQLSQTPANDWEPAVAAGADGTAWVSWDSYERGQYDIHLRSYKGSEPGPLERITTGPRFQAHASIAVDPQGRPWVAWNESGVNWGKDQGFLLPTPLATPLHQQRWLKLVVRDAAGFREPGPLLETALPPAMRANAEHPQIHVTPSGTAALVFRHWTRIQSRSIGAGIVWENYAMYWDGRQWSHPKPLPDSGSWIEKLPALTTDSGGDLWAVWMTDNRPFTTMIPGNSDIYAGKLDRPGRLDATPRMRAYVEPVEEAIPVHSNDADDVKAIQAHRISSEGKTYRIFRGDMHRHTDISQDFKYDGSLFELYRYARDAAGFDYIAPTDHQTGYDQEYSWWQNQKYVDVFLVPGSFTPMFAYERSLKFPNGHRNVVFAERGVRTLPIPAEEASGQEGAAKLYAYLKQNKGISMPHSSATDQGTDWRDNDPEVEPLIEIYQGYRASYEYEGAPRAATALNQHAQKSGWQPAGFYWNALAKGYKLGVQASSDHWSTHISYACLLVEGPSREQILDAIRKRHAYGATDNIILDFRAKDGAREYIMGDAFTATGSPALSITVAGTNPIKQIDVIRDKQFIYTTRPQSRNTNFSFTDSTKPAGESWYYVRVMQEDGQLAWSSPIWIKK